MVSLGELSLQGENRKKMGDFDWYLCELEPECT